MILPEIINGITIIAVIDQHRGQEPIRYIYIYLINNDYIGPQGKLASTSERQYLMLTGDPIFIDFDFDGKINHSTVITSYQAGYSAGTKVAAHTTNAFNKPISAYGGSHKYVRLIGYMK